MNTVADIHEAGAPVGLDSKVQPASGPRGHAQPGRGVDTGMRILAIAPLRPPITGHSLASEVFLAVGESHQATESIWHD
jgi:hypothetical protein